jgi:hypothetical protein
MGIVIHGNMWYVVNCWYTLKESLLMYSRRQRLYQQEILIIVTWPFTGVITQK